MITRLRIRAAPARGGEVPAPRPASPPARTRCDHCRRTADQAFPAGSTSHCLSPYAALALRYPARASSSSYSVPLPGTNPPESQMIAVGA